MLPSPLYATVIFRQRRYEDDINTSDANRWPGNVAFFFYRRRDAANEGARYAISAE